MCSLILFLTLLLVVLIAAVPGDAQESPPSAAEDAGVLEAEPEEAAVSTAEAFALPAFCRVKVDAVFWGGRQWLELGQALAEDLSPCAEYYISIPPVDGNDAKELRAAARFAEVRALSPQIHPLAEIRYSAPNRSDWREFALDRGGDLDDFFDAGVEARRRMAMGTPPRIDVAAGETWALNEFDATILENVPGRRAEMLAFLRGLYDGGPARPDVRGVVFNIGPLSDETEVAAYKASLQEWLTDESFWRALDTYVDFFAHEVYASPATWGVAGVPRARRAQYLNDYFFHFTSLAEAGPDAAQAARTFLHRAYLPLGNALWPSAAVGTEALSPETMAQFVSTQVYAIRHYANSHPQGPPQGRIGFGWAPLQEVVPGYTPEGRDLLRRRLASAIRESSDQGTNSPTHACGPPGDNVWCEGEVEGAALNDAWKAFTVWD
jgi:hypothetical protein